MPGFGGSHRRIEKRILFITSYTMSHVWTRDVAVGFNDYFQSQPSIGVDVAEMGISYNQGIFREQINEGWILGKIKKGDYRVIVVADMPAGELLLQNQEFVPPEIPLVFCGGIPVDMVRSFSRQNKTGLLRPFSIEQNISLGLSCMPDATEIAVITASGLEGEELHRRLKQSPPECGRAKLALFNGAEISTAKLMAELKKLPKESFVLYINWKSSKRDTFLTHFNIVESIIDSSPGPVFSNTDSYLEFGLLGGLLISGKNHGRHAAAMCDQILAGIPVSRYRVDTDQLEYLFNWPVFQQYGLDEKVFQNPVFINRPPTWLEEHRYEVVVVCGLGLLCLSWIFYLWRDRRKMRQRQAVFREMPIRVVVTDGNGKIYFHQAEGAVPESGVGDLPQRVAVRFHDSIVEVLATGEKKRKEYDESGRRRKAVFTKLPKEIFGAETALMVSLDITELTKSREELNKTIKYLRTILESIGDGVIVTDADQTVTICNPVAGRLIGRRSEDVLGKPLNEVFRIVSYHDDSPVVSPTEQAIRENVVVELANHTDLISFDGTRRHIADSAAPIHAEDGTITGAVLVFRDVTAEYNARDRMRLTHQLMQRVSELAHIEYFSRNESTGKNNIECRRYWNFASDGTPLPAEDWVIDEDLAAFKAGWRRLFAGDISSLQLTYRTREHGEYRYYLLNAMARYSETAHPKLEEVYGLIQDITELQRSRFEAEKNSKILGAILDNLPVGICVKNPDDEFRFQIWNHFFAERNGISADEILGKTAEEVNLLPDLRKQFTADDLRTLEEGLITVPEECFDVHGRKTFYETTKQLLTMSSGERLLVVLCVDMTRQKRWEQEQKKMLLQAQEANRAKSMFLATMSHEIRTPLNAVIGFSELLQENGVTEAERKEYLLAINSAGNALLQLINDILDLSKLDSGKMNIVYEWSDLQKLVQELTAIFSAKIREKGLALTIYCPDQLPMMRLSAPRLRQVLLNLIGNAVKFTSAGKVAIEIDFAQKNEQEGVLILRVRDTGPGIAEKNREAVFNPFVQEDRAHHQQEGTGLGLTISKRLIENMNGSLELDTKVGIGCCFSITLPGIQYRGGWREKAPVVDKDIQLRQIPHRILLVDDVPINLCVLSSILKKFHAEVVTATSGAEALEKLMAFEPTLILTDMWMPGMSGIELAFQIRQNRKYENTPIFAVTADMEAEGRLPVGVFTGIIFKPVSHEKLLGLLRTIDKVRGDGSGKTEAKC